MGSWEDILFLLRGKKRVDERTGEHGYDGWESSLLTRRSTRLRDGGLSVIPLGN